LPEPLKVKWHGVIRKFTADWIQKNAFKKRATLWMWGCMSVNLISRHPQYSVPSWSDFILQFGLPGRFISELDTALAGKFDDQAALTEIITFKRDDGWAAICHIEQGRAWAPEGDDSWRPL
jgi:hypothetical protein